MSQASVTYTYNEKPSRALALAGVFMFVKLLLLIPHIIVLGVLGWFGQVVAYIGYWVVAFTGKMPDGIVAILEMVLRWGTRTTGWFAGITDEYPPFETDPQGYPFELTVPANENPSRGLAAAGIVFIIKPIMLIPHFVALFFVYIGVAVATWVGFFITAITGTLPTAIQDFLAGATQWYQRAQAWLFGLTDDYPPFSLEIRPTS